MQREPTKTVAKELRQLRQEMMANGVKRISCFNGGLDPVTYRYNARAFELETKIKRAEGDI